MIHILIADPDSAMSKAYPDLNIILLSADANHASEARAVNADFVKKCLPAEELISALHTLIINKNVICSFSEK